MLLAAQMFEGLVAYGYIGLILYMILTGCGLPMPEEVAIIAGAAFAAAGKLDPWLTLASLLAGALLGDCVMYYIGYHFGRRLLEQNRFWNKLITPEREKKVEELLNQHGVKVLLGAGSWSASAAQCISPPESCRCPSENSSWPICFARPLW